MIPDEAVVLRRTDACTCDYTTVTDFERRDGGFVPNRYEVVTRQSKDCPEHRPPATIIEFLEARIAEDEAEALNAPRTTDAFDANRNAYTPALRARVLAECAAKRAIIRLFRDGAMGEVFNGQRWANPLEPFAAIYAEHPDYEQEWAA